MCDRSYSVLKEEILKVIPIIEEALNASGDSEVVIIDETEIARREVHVMLEEFKRILDSNADMEITHGLIPMKLLVTSKKMRAIQVVINGINNCKLEEELKN